MDESAESLTGTPSESFARRLDLPTHVAFGRFVSTLVPPDSAPVEQISGIQEAGRRFNASAGDHPRIILLYHFTDASGAQGIRDTGLVGKSGVDRTYLTPITPDMAQPLGSAQDAAGFELYFRQHRVPHSLAEHMHRFILAMKFKWNYHVRKELLGQPIVPVGADRLENVVILATQEGSPALKHDDHGEIYLDQPASAHSDPHFTVFGPFPTPETSDV